MSKTLDEIAQELKNNSKKVQLIYAFNGTGKTRLSKTFKQLIVPNPDELARNKILYYNAFTEDLFYWNNDLNEDREPKLKIQPNSFTNWVLKEQAQDQNVITYFQRYSNENSHLDLTLILMKSPFHLLREMMRLKIILKFQKEKKATLFGVFFTPYLIK